MVTDEGMKDFNFELRDGSIHITDFPDGVRVIALNSREAKQLEHYGSHKSDLYFSLSCLEKINAASDDIVQEALWRSAIIFYIKCFTAGSARSTALKLKKIHPSDELARKSHEYFDNLRNKHLIHDENAYTMSKSGAIINNGTKPFKVEKIINLSGRGGTLEQANYGNLHLLISTALKWLDRASFELCNLITSQLEGLTIDELLSRPQAYIRTPDVTRISQRRFD